MRHLQSLPPPRAKTRYEWRPLLPGLSPREGEVLILGGELGVREHVRLSGQDYPSWTKWCWEVSSLLFMLFSLCLLLSLTYVLRIAHRSCVLHRFVKDECTVWNSWLSFFRLFFSKRPRFFSSWMASSLITHRCACRESAVIANHRGGVFLENRQTRHRLTTSAN